MQESTPESVLGCEELPSGGVDDVSRQAGPIFKLPSFRVLLSSNRQLARVEHTIRERIALREDWSTIYPPRAMVERLSLVSFLCKHDRVLEWRPCDIADAFWPRQSTFKSFATTSSEDLVVVNERIEARKGLQIDGTRTQGAS